MDCVKLYYKDELLGILTYNTSRYIFVKNDRFSNPNLLKYVGLCDKNEYFSDHLFGFFYKFIPEKKREDIILKAGISIEKDSEYEILKKVAKLDLNKSQFWIGL